MIVDGNNFIRHYLKNNTSFCCGKIGVTELNILYCYFHLKNGGNLLPHLKHEVENIAGMYPYNSETVNKFAEDTLNRLKYIDLIPKWSKILPDFENFIFNTYCPKAHITDLMHFEPYFYDKPWSEFLKDKKVLVFSPFKESIDNNFKNLSKIWNNKLTNNFDLNVVKYPFAITLDNNTSYKTSQEVYKKYLDILSKENFDVGIFGTGYTSLLFATECKKMNKIGMHLGGATQMLFGVKGQRWKDNDKYQPFFNDFWSTPLNSEIPEKHKLVEGGCYW
jgi:hypothetical protein